MAKESGSNADVLWLVAGLAVGGALGLLFAPRPGNETRRKIADFAADGRDTLSDRGRDLLDKGREYVDRGRDLADAASELFEKGRRLADG
jgi:gas vesicle protein